MYNSFNGHQYLVINIKSIYYYSITSQDPMHKLYFSNVLALVINHGNLKRNSRLTVLNILSGRILNIHG